MYMSRVIFATSEKCFRCPATYTEPLVSVQYIDDQRRPLPDNIDAQADIVFDIPIWLQNPFRPFSIICYSCSLAAWKALDPLEQRKVSYQAAYMH